MPFYHFSLSLRWKEEGERDAQTHFTSSSSMLLAVGLNRERVRRRREKKK